MDAPAISHPDRWTGEYNDVTRKLIALTEADPELRDLLEQSIQKANKQNPDQSTNPVDDLTDYFRFVDRMSQLIPRDVLENPRDLVRDEILQSICYFYFLVDQELPALKGRGLYKNTLQYYGPFADWMRDFADAWGQFLDTEKSWNRKTYREFYADERFGLQEGWYEHASNWNTFNDFFARYLRTPAVRPIESGDSVVCSPADSVPQGVWHIDDRSRIAVEGSGGSGRTDGGVRVKNKTHYSVEDLLGSDSGYADAFAGGTFTHTFLNVNDYHRYHFPIGGKVVEKDQIEENVALEVAWNDDEKRYDPNDSTGWQFTQTRGYVIVDTGEFGVVGLVPMGMAQVSSVEFEDNVQVGHTFEKGDLLGNFLFGGSDFVMLFEEEAGFEIEAPEQSPTGGEGGRPTYEHVKMGELYGVLNG
ncbi:phosphatidylserine decarboxylase [Halorussus salilacus]|uniref:phosphatidylserine decarboxylase n=1 Tax=Halorussus salilacus TaxID=2953750 RepID=UPI00209F6924|nr:phosphatidylserine decarboxylase [Halorussus salilacus]USZ67581.1 phosphatidylserine decarboxylase [Halorussus salilacus]